MADTLRRVLLTDLKTFYANGSGNSCGYRATFVVPRSEDEGTDG